MFLILEDFIPELISLLEQCLLLLLELLDIAILPLASQVLLYLVGEVLVQILGHLKLLLHDLQLVLQGLVQVLVL